VTSFESRTADPFDGILLVDKPSDHTSHDVVARIRGRFGLEKVGHGGTLDPSATGLLVLLLGRATRLSNFYLSSDKTYEGVMRIGFTSDSYDADGVVSPCGDPSGITREQVEQEMAKVKGDRMQTPPMVSAVKIKGVPLYKLARRGEENVERKPRLIHVYEFRMTNFAAPEIAFVLKCTKGTYVRSICHDMGQTLGCGAILTSLRRTQSGMNTLDKALTLDHLLSIDRTELQKLIIPLQKLLSIPGGPRLD
jgi:tRNA pseudouridine55 synthase